MLCLCQGRTPGKESNILVVDRMRNQLRGLSQASEMTEIPADSRGNHSVRRASRKYRNIQQGVSWKCLAMLS